LPAICRFYLGVHVPSAQWRGLAVVVLAGCVAFALCHDVQVLWRKYSDNYSTANPSFVARISEHVEPPAVVFIKSKYLYSSLLYLLPNSDAAPIIYARDLGARNRQLLHYYPDRHGYIVRDEFTIEPIK
jgi:hypothetical protein